MTTVAPVTAMPLTPVMTVQMNLSQSMKSKAGIKFNQYVNTRMEFLSNGKTVIFVRSEPIFIRGGFKKTWIRPQLRVQMDQEILVIDHEKKEILCIMTDGTTTYRKDRQRGKAFEGINQYSLIPEIESDLISRYANLENYTVTHLNVSLFPSKMKSKLQDYERECKNVRDFSINVNYGLNEFRSHAGCHLIDAAMNIDEFEAVIAEIAAHPEKYSFTKDLIAHVWTQLFNTWEYQPSMALTVDNVKADKVHVVYCINRTPKDYTNEAIDAFAQEVGIKFNKKTRGAKLRTVVEYINHHM